MYMDFQNLMLYITNTIFAHQLQSKTLQIISHGIVLNKIRIINDKSTGFYVEV